MSTLTVTRTFRASARGGAILGARRRIPVGATVRYRLSEAARTRFAVERLERAGASAAGASRRPGPTARDRLRFSGQLRNRRLPAVRYRLVAAATDAAGDRSAAKRRAFRIVRR